MDLSIVIVTHNSRSPVEKCLASIGEHPPSGSFEIIVVDNASVDGTPDMIEERFPSVRLVRNRENIGYSRGVNSGIGRSGARNLLVLNPDILVGEGSIDRLVDFLERTPPDVVIQRLAADALGDTLIAPAWVARKTDILVEIDRELERRGTRQGSLYRFA